MNSGPGGGGRELGERIKWNRTFSPEPEKETVCFHYNKDFLRKLSGLLLITKVSFCIFLQCWESNPGFHTC
jgi:hypothetical protein